MISHTVCILLKEKNVSGRIGTFRKFGMNLIQKREPTFSCIWQKLKTYCFANSYHFPFEFY
jgi:hypothetical protein